MILKASDFRDLTTRALESSSIPTDPALPFLDLPSRYGVKEPKAVAKRIISLYALAGLANEADPDLLRCWLVEIGCFGDLLQSEQGLFDRSLTRQEELDLSWRQESLIALAWSGRVVEELSLPAEQGDLGPVFPRIPPEVEVSRFVSDFTLRNVDELYAQADLHYCFHWALRHPEEWKGRAFMGRPAIDVVTERRQALEWLIGAAQSWDEVNLDT